MEGTGQYNQGDRTNRASRTLQTYNDFENANSDMAPANSGPAPRKLLNG